MYHLLKKQPNIRGIAAAAVATGEIPTSGTHYATYLRCLSAAGVPLTRAQMITDIGDIVVRIDGEQVVEASVTFLLDLQKYYGDAFGAGNVDGIIPIFWERPHLVSEQERGIFAIGMQDVDSFTIDVSILGIAVLSSIEVLAEVTPEVRRFGQHVRISRFPQAGLAAAGVQEITNLPKEGDRVAYLAMHIEEGASTIDLVTAKIGGNDIYDEVDPGLNAVLLARAKRALQAGYFPVDFSLSNDLSGMIPMAKVQDFRQQITWAGVAGNYSIYTERIFGLNIK